MMDERYQNFVERLDECLEKRALEWPERGAAHRRSKELIRDFTRWLVETNDPKRLKPDKETLSLGTRLIENPVFICGNMKSGTTLLTQLLDGHENLLVLIGGTKYIIKYHKKSINYDKISELWMEKLVNPTGQKPFWWLGRDEESFREFLALLDWLYKNQDKDDFQKLLVAFFSAFCAQHQKIKYWIEKTTGNEKKVYELIKHYPKAKFIHIYRDPLSNMASIKKWSQNNKKNFSAAVWSMHFYASLRRGILNRKKYGPRVYHTLKYEDLTANPAVEMKRICDFLEIPFTPGLLIPTQGKKAATSNSVYEDRRVRGSVDHQDIHRWERELEDRDKEIVVSLLFNKARMSGYGHWESAGIRKYSKRRKKIVYIIVYLIEMIKKIQSRVFSFH